MTDLQREEQLTANIRRELHFFRLMELNEAFHSADEARTKQIALMKSEGIHHSEIAKVIW